VNELLALILVKLDRYSLSTLVLTSKKLFNRSNDQELLNTLYPQSITPSSRLLVFHDYEEVEPQYYIPVHIFGKYKMIKLDNSFVENVGMLFYEDDFIIEVEVSVNNVSELVIFNYSWNSEGHCCYLSRYSEDIDFRIVTAGGRKYKFDITQPLIKIIDEIYQDKQYRIVL
jgi:hypothetical protein